MSKEKEKIGDWLKIARTDWERTKRNLRDKDTISAGFFLQQCVEKYLKAFLIKHGWKLKKIHRLDALLDEAIKIMSALSSFYEFCEKVSPYYQADRYPPFADLKITEEDINENLEKAKEFIKKLFPEEELNE